MLRGMMPFEFAMEEVGTALSRLGDAFATDDPITRERACYEGRWVYRSMADLYPKLQLDSTQRDSLVRQLVLLRSRVKEREEEAKRFSDADSG